MLDENVRAFMGEAMKVLLRFPEFREQRMLICKIVGSEIWNLGVAYTKGESEETLRCKIPTYMVTKVPDKDRAAELYVEFLLFSILSVAGNQLLAVLKPGFAPALPNSWAKAEYERFATGDRQLQNLEPYRPVTEFGGRKLVVADEDCQRGIFVSRRCYSAYTVMFHTSVVGDGEIDPTRLSQFGDGVASELLYHGLLRQSPISQKFYLDRSKHSRVQLDPDEWKKTKPEVLEQVEVGKSEKLYGADPITRYVEKIAYLRSNYTFILARMEKERVELIERLLTKPAWNLFTRLLLGEGPQEIAASIAEDDALRLFKHSDPSLEELCDILDQVQITVFNVSPFSFIELAITGTGNVHFVPTWNEVANNRYFKSVRGVDLDQQIEWIEELHGKPPAWWLPWRHFKEWGGLQLPLVDQDLFKAYRFCLQHAYKSGRIPANKLAKVRQYVRRLTRLRAIRLMDAKGNYRVVKGFECYVEGRGPFCNPKEKKRKPGRRKQLFKAQPKLSGKAKRDWRPSKRFSQLTPRERTVLVEAYLASKKGSTNTGLIGMAQLKAKDITREEVLALGEALDFKIYKSARSVYIPLQLLRSTEMQLLAERYQQLQGD